MQNEQDKKSDFKLWDLVKNSAKKLKANNDYSSSPKKAVSKKTLPSSNQKILNSLNISSMFSTRNPRTYSPEKSDVSKTSAIPYLESRIRIPLI